jgi:hypothetical protein
MDSTTRLAEAIQEASAIAKDVVGIGKVLGEGSKIELWRLRCELQFATNATDIALGNVSTHARPLVEYRADVERRCEEHLDAEMKKTAHLPDAIRPHRDGRIRN